MRIILFVLLTAIPYAAKSQTYIENQLATEKPGRFWIDDMGAMKKLSLGDAHNNGQILFHNGGFDINHTKRRWAVGLDIAETGTAATGSDFMLWSYNDAGGYKGLAMTVARSSHLLSLYGGLFMNNNTSNTIMFGSAGFGAPTTGTRSAGAKLVLLPSLSPVLSDYALGVQQGGGYTEAWLGMPDSVAGHGLVFYGGVRKAGRIDGRGNTQWEGQGRFKGWFSPGSGDGPAAEIGVSGGVAAMIGYNRSSIGYIPAYMAGGNGSLFTSMLLNETGLGLGVGTGGTFAGKLSIYDNINGRSTITIQSASNSRFWIQEGGSVLRIGGSGTAAPAMGAINVTSAGLVGIGTLAPQSELSVNGTITSKKVKVLSNGWADYVFRQDYQLPTLGEVERHIREKGHLKDIPSEQEVEKNGVDLGEMNKKLLAKVEELTLYLIEQNKKLEALEKWKGEQEAKSIK